MKIIVTEKIHLAEFAPSDEAACLEHLQEKEIYDRTLRIPFPYTAEDFRAWLQIVEQTTAEQGRAVHWAIRDESGSLIGGCGFDNLQIGKSHRAELGYWLAKPYWGRGIMTAVVRRLCDLAIAEFGVTKITAHVFADNPASAKVLQKCGFQKEGYLRKHYVKDGQYLDAKLFARLKS